ncbi:hypothetical protein M8R20_44575 [Pseudomonas sp. R2.Fl]|nr:hypothetical protein [Pseudomonas sp. R2.Fl]
MKRMLRTLSGILLALGILAGALYAASWLLWPTRAQKQALAEMTAPLPVPAGRNAFADVWLLRYDLTPAERVRIAADDVERFNRRGAPAFGADGTVAAETPGFTSAAEGRYPAERLQDPDRVLCESTGVDCLDKVRAKPEQVRALLDAHAGLLQRTRDALENSDYLRMPFRLTYETPFAIAAMSDGMRLMRTDAAQAFVQGDHDAGLTRACRAADAWRRWMREPDLLIDLMMGDAALSGWLDLQGQMLASLPADVPLPAACASLRDPPSLDERSFCRVVQREFEFTRSLIELAGDGAVMQPGEPGWLTSLAYRKDATLAMMAETRAWHCGGSVRRELLADQRVSERASPGPWRLECASNWFGCQLVAMEYPGMTGYLHRLQDQRSRLNLMATLLWLREQPVDGRTLAQRVAARPVALRQGRDIEVVENRLRVPLFDAGEKTHWELEVPEAVRQDLG